MKLSDNQMHFCSLENHFVTLCSQLTSIYSVKAAENGNGDEGATRHCCSSSAAGNERPNLLSLVVVSLISFFESVKMEIIQ